MITHSQPLIFPSVEFLVTVRVFHCPQTTTLSQAFLYCVISFYGVVSYMVVRRTWFVLDYAAAVSYRLGFFALSRLGGVYRAESHHAVWADDGNRFLDEVTEIPYICSAIWLLFVLVKQASNRISLRVEVTQKSLPFRFYTLG